MKNVSNTFNLSKTETGSLIPLGEPIHAAHGSLRFMEVQESQDMKSHVFFILNVGNSKGHCVD